jgi:hypothetical protein
LGRCKPGSSKFSAPTDHPRIDAWAERIGEWVKRGLPPAAYVIEQLNKRRWTELKAPKVQEDDAKPLTLF